MTDYNLDPTTIDSDLLTAGVMRAMTAVITQVRDEQRKQLALDAARFIAPTTTLHRVLGQSAKKQNAE